MAFRSDLEGARARADAAEATLAEHELRIAHAKRTTQQLKQLVRTVGTSATSGDRRRTAIAAATGALTAGLLVTAFFWWHDADVRRALDATQVKFADAESRARVAERDAADTRFAERDAADARLAELVRDADDARRDLATSGDTVTRLHRETLLMLSTLPTAGDADHGAVLPITLPPVGWIEGNAPVGLGTPCSLVHSTHRTCAADVRCGDVVVHRYGCLVEPPTSQNAGGAFASFRNDTAGWEVGLGDPPARAVEASTR